MPPTTKCYQFIGTLGSQSVCLSSRIIVIALSGRAITIKVDGRKTEKTAAKKEEVISKLLYQFTKLSKQMFQIYVCVANNMTAILNVIYGERGHSASHRNFGSDHDADMVGLAIGLFLGGIAVHLLIRLL